MKEVIMPKMGDAMEEGVLLEWLKKEGDAVQAGDPLATIQTDKATLEMEAEDSGTLAGILVNPGESVPVGTPLALLLGVGESVPPGWGASAPAAAATSQAEATAPGGATSPKRELITVGGSLGAAASSVPGAEAQPPVSLPTPEREPGRIKASPLARKVASELGVDLTTVTGTGPGGRIIEDDVRAAARGVTQEPTPKLAPIEAGRGDTYVPLSRIRQITAQRTLESKRQAPHFYVTVEVDVEAVLALKEQFEREGAAKLSINDFVTRACVLALLEMPQVNSSFQGDKLLQYGSVNVGMAVALEDGLTVPVIHEAHRLSLRQIAERTRELAKKAREGRLTLEELSGSTFSISNMGMLNVDNFAAIINSPNAAIVAVSTARKVVVPVVEDETAHPGATMELGEPGEGVSLAIRTRMNLTGSFDHRVVDGAVGAKFMNLVREALQNPTRLLS